MDKDCSKCKQEIDPKDLCCGYALLQRNKELVEEQEELIRSRDQNKMDAEYWYDAYCELSNFVRWGPK